MEKIGVKVEEWENNIFIIGLEKIILIYSRSEILLHKFFAKNDLTKSQTDCISKSRNKILANAKDIKDSFQLQKFH